MKKKGMLHSKINKFKWESTKFAAKYSIITFFKSKLGHGILSVYCKLLHCFYIF